MQFIAKKQKSRRLISVYSDTHAADLNTLSRHITLKQRRFNVDSTSSKLKQRPFNDD